MTILPIYIYDQSILRKKAKQLSLEKVDRSELRRFAGDMFETMHNANGIGLAANQVGSLQRVIVIDVSDMEETKGMRPLVIVNPLVEREEGRVVMEEGCLSIPDIREEVDRAEQISVRYRDLDLSEQVITASGMLARVLLHEIDHLNGVLFIDKLDVEKKKLLRGRLNKIRRGEIEVGYPVVVSAAVDDHHKVAVK